MWTRKELKDNAKKRMNANYWKTVLAAFIMLIVLGGTSKKMNFSFNADDFKDADFSSILSDGTEVGVQGIKDALSEMGVDADDLVIDGKKIFSEDGINPNLNSEDLGSALSLVLLPIMAIVAGIVFLASLISIVLKIFLMHPLEVGGRSFFIENHDTEASVKNYGLAFKTNYMNIVLTMFLRSLFTSLWSLLLVVPGIIKAYEYRMIPYILAQNPDINYKEAFEESKKLMTGNKWNAFVLDLSFIGWGILNACTFGILGIFYVNPYVYQTSAELYIRLKYGNTDSIEENPVYNNYVEVQ